MTQRHQDTEPREARSAPLDMSADEFREVGHRLVDTIADELTRLRTRPVTPAESPEQVRQIIDADEPLPESGRSAAPLLRKIAAQLFDHSLFNGHPRFFGYITSSAAPIGALGDLLAAAVNPNVGGWKLSPVATELETQTVRWIAELVGYPTDGGGVLVSGGNIANFVGWLAARTAKIPWEVRRAGLRAGQPLRVYASTETHTWIQKAADMSGVGTDAIRWIPANADQRIDLAALRHQIDTDRAAGDVPFLVVGTAGSVSTGAIDPLPALAAICREYGLWFHVDGAYGAAAALVPGVPADLRGLREADSMSVDPHKWLYAPLEAGCVLVRDPHVLRDTFSYQPPYYHLERAVTNYYDLGPQNSRGFRALKVWLALRQVGRAGFLQMIGDDIRLAQELFEQVARHEEFQALTQHLSITTFRYVPRDLKTALGSAPVETYLNQLNEHLLTQIEESGRAFLSNAIVDGAYALRACIVNFRTTASDVEALPTIVVELGRDADRSLRPETLRAAPRPHEGLGHRKTES